MVARRREKKSDGQRGRPQRARWTPRVVKVRVAGDAETIERQVIGALRDAAARVREGIR